MNNNIFEGAKFGDKFLMQCGKLAIYYGIDTISGKHIIIGEGDPNYKYRYVDGRCFDDGTCDYDIVSHYTEPIDEDKLDELAYNECPENSYHVPEDGLDDAWMEGFKVGYRKAMEE